jgi:hypothetical protein
MRTINLTDFAKMRISRTFDLLAAQEANPAIGQRQIGGQKARKRIGSSRFRCNLILAYLVENNPKKKAIKESSSNWNTKERLWPCAKPFNLAIAIANTVSGEWVDWSKGGQPIGNSDSQSAEFFSA